MSFLGKFTMKVVTGNYRKFQIEVVVGDEILDSTLVQLMAIMSYMFFYNAQLLRTRSILFHDISRATTSLRLVHWSFLIVFYGLHLRLPSLAWKQYAQHW